MLWLVTHWKLIAIAGLVLAIPVSYKAGHYFGVSEGKNAGFLACEKEKFEAFQLGADSRKGIDVKVKKLSASDVDKLLTDNEWMRRH